LSAGKLLIFGIDGASYPLVKKWSASGRLKTFKRLMDDGSYGVLRSTKPPITFPAIPSFMTGKNPGKHGVASFFRPKKDRSLGLVSSSSVEDEFWNIGRMNNRKKLIINLPLTFPAKPLTGHVVTGPLTPNKEDEGFMYPASVRDRIGKVLDPYIIDVESKYSPGKEKDYWNACREAASERMKFIRHLVKAFDWDLCIIYFTILDRIQHNLFGRDDNSWILKGYRMMDEYLGEMLLGLRDDTNLMVFSDHGFGRSRGRFYPNSLLSRMGHLKYTRRGFRASFEGKIRTMQFNPLVRFIAKITPNFIIKRGIKAVEDGSSSFNFDTIDWERTKAYGSINGIYLSSKTGKDRKKIIREITKELKELKDPKTKKKLKTEVYRREELYSGINIDKLPDIVYCIEDYAYEPFASFESVAPVQSFRNEYKGWHREEGLFMAYGPDMECGEIKEARITDLAPTILHMYGCGIPKDMDGVVLKGIFAEDSTIYEREISYQKDPSAGLNTHLAEDHTPQVAACQEKAQLKAKIRALMRSGEI